MQLKQEEVYEMVKTAKTAFHSCGHKCQCHCTEKNHCDSPCTSCQQKKQAQEDEQQEQREQKKPVGRRILNTAKDLAEKAGLGLAAAVTGLASLAKPAPPSKVNERY